MKKRRDKMEIMASRPVGMLESLVLTIGYRP
ncbi:hypothetical protein VPHD249_0120 [Vibrio phage D249]